MAINMLGSRCMVKAGLGLSTLPAQEEWVEDVEIVSLIHNSIKEIPAVRQQRWALPRLLELHMGDNISLKSIDGSFFGCMPTLQVLDLSRTGIRMLPSSISNLVNLTHLLLCHCQLLRHVPSLAKLKALRTLDLFYSGIEEVPAGLQELVNLRCLDFDASRLKQLPPGILPELSNLQILCLGGQGKSLTVQVQEIMSLSKLESLSCRFGDVQSYDLYVKHLQAGGPKEWELELLEGPRGIYDGIVSKFPVCSRTVRLQGCCVRGDGPKSPPMLPKDVQHLEIRDAVDGLKSLTDIPSITNSKLTTCTLVGIRGMKYVLSVSQSSSSPLPSLEFLELRSMMDLHVLADEELCAAAPAVPGVLYEVNEFWGLKALYIYDCQKMKRLLTHVLLPLANLEELAIGGCEQMEEVIAMPEVDTECQDEGDTSGSYTRSEANHVHLASALSLNKMRTLDLRELPALKSICRATISCPSLQRVSLFACPKLECTSVLVQLPRDGEPPSNCLQEIKIHIGEAERYNPVIWEHSLS